MTRIQRFMYDMFVRVRDFGLANVARFPESSNGGRKFAQMAAAVAAIDQHMKQHALGQVEAQRVNPLTRSALRDSMRTIADAARRFTRVDRKMNPFRMPRRRTYKGELASAKLFVEQAESQQEAFIEAGLQPTFLSDLKSVVAELQQAVDRQVNSKTVRRQARAGIASTFKDGLEVVRDLHVIVSVAVKKDPTLAAAWQAARHIDGQSSSPSTSKPADPVAPAVPAPTSPAPSTSTLPKAS